MTRMLKKALESILTSKESDELISAFDQIGDIINKEVRKGANIF